MAFLAAHRRLGELLVSLALLLAAYTVARFVSYLVGLAIDRSTRGGTDRRLLSALKRPVTCTDLARVKEVLRRAALVSPRVDPAREPVVLITRFGESAVDFQLMFWARDYGEQGLARSDVYEAVYDALAAAGIEIPLPTRRIVQERD